MTMNLTGHSTQAASRRGERRWLSYALSLGMLASSMILVHAARPVVGTPLGMIVWLGAIPWFLQCVSVALLLDGVVRCRERTGEAVWSAFLGAVSVGAIWWGGVLLFCGRGDYVSLLVKAAIYDVRSGFGRVSPGEGFLFEVVGPLTCPALLSGPLVLTGWDFAGCLLSSMWVIALLTWIGHLMRRGRGKGGPVLQRLLLTIGMVLYIAPCIVRTALRIGQVAFH
jgi:hypothetical protein